MLKLIVDYGLLLIEVESKRMERKLTELLLKVAQSILIYAFHT
jgi:hypothetical protein